MILPTRISDVVKSSLGIAPSAPNPRSESVIDPMLSNPGAAGGPLVEIPGIRVVPSHDAATEVPSVVIVTTASNGEASIHGV